MHIRIFFSLIAAIAIFGGIGFADGSIISVQTNSDNYIQEDVILISGHISTIIGNTQVSLQLFNDGNLIDVDQIEIGQDGNYATRINAQGPLWKNPGIYTVKVVYGEANIAETTFNFLPLSSTIKTTDNFEVSAGDSGTFDIKYIITGGTIEEIKIHPEIFGLILTIDSPHRGTLIIDLPREFIDAEKQNGKDEEFIVIINNIQSPYDESTTFSEFRTLTINFEKGDSEIQIIGTYVIPEFGTIVMIILTIGIMASILLTKNRFQIKI